MSLRFALHDSSLRRRLPCSLAWSVVVLCFLASSRFMAAKAFGPVWGSVIPSTPWCLCCCGALCSRTPIGHPFCYTLAAPCSMCGILCSYPSLPCRRPLSLLLVVGCVCLSVCGVFPSLCAKFYLHLGERRPLAITMVVTVNGVRSLKRFRLVIAQKSKLRLTGSHCSICFAQP